MDALLSVYGDGRTEHSDGLVALAPASGGGRVAVAGWATAALAAGGTPSGGWRAMVGQRAARTGGRADWRSSGGRGGWRSTGAGSGNRATAPRWAAASLAAGDGTARASGIVLVAGGAPSGERGPSSGGGRAAAALAAGGGRWSGSVLRGRAGERTGAAPAGTTGGTTPGWAAAAGWAAAMLATGDGAARVVNLCDVWLTRCWGCVRSWSYF